MVPLKRLVRINERALPEDCEPDRKFRYVDIATVGRGVLVAEPQRTTFEQAPSRARRLVLPGDTILSTVRTYLRAVWPVDDPTDDLVVSTGFAVLTPGPDLDSRFLGWLAQSNVVVDEIVARSVGVSYPAINASDVGDVRVPCPPLATQRAIADFLDAETAGIDALIVKKRQLSEAVTARAEAAVGLVLRGGGVEGSLPDGWEWVAARRLCPAITVGVVVDPSSYFAETGIPFIHGTDVRRGWIDEQQFKYVSPESNALLRKSQLSGQDVIAMRVGEPGRAAVVPDHLTGANCASVLIFRRSHRLASRILCEFLNTPLGRSQITAMQYGAAQGVLNVAHAQQLMLPVPPVEAQAGIVALIDEAQARARGVVSLLLRQIALLRERRQALITAAVTGELSILGAAA